MNFFKKNHTLVDQNEKSVKKSHKHDANLQKNTTLYFQIGLILCLLISYGLLEMEFDRTTIPVEQGVLSDESLVYIDVPIFKIEKKIKNDPVPKMKKVIVIDPTIVENDTEIKNIVENIITEPEPYEGPELNPEDLKDIVDLPEEIPLSFKDVQNVPIYPGCENFSINSERKQCMSDKINKLVSRKFDTGIVDELGLNGKHRIQVQFKIDKFGYVTQVKTRATHPRLEKEARKTVDKIPKMIPGRQNDKNVEVIFTLPIVVKAQN